MIVSHRHRFVFLAVPRTGTHSVRQALRPLLGDDDWEQQMLNGRRALPVSAIARLGHGHVSARMAAAHLPAAVWSSYFKFAFVRNPFDRLVSACCFLNRGNREFAGHETEFMRRALANPRFRGRVLVTPQTHLLCDVGGHPALDYVGRYEHFERDFAAVCAELGIRSAPLPVSNRSVHRHYPDYYDAALEATVAELYRTDFAAFGYAPRLPSRRGAPCS